MSGTKPKLFIRLMLTQGAKNYIDEMTTAFRLIKIGNNDCIYPAPLAPPPAAPAPAAPAPAPAALPPDECVAADMATKATIA